MPARSPFEQFEIVLVGQQGQHQGVDPLASIAHGPLIGRWRWARGQRRCPREHHGQQWRRGTAGGFAAAGAGHRCRTGSGASPPTGRRRSCGRIWWRPPPVCWLIWRPGAPARQRPSCWPATVPRSCCRGCGRPWPRGSGSCCSPAAIRCGSASVACCCSTFPAERIRFHPAPTSLQLAFARLGRPWQDASWISLHGRDPEPLAARLQQRPAALAVLTDPARGGAGEVRRILQSSGLEAAYQFWLGERLGHPAERLRQLSPADPLPQDLDPLHLVLLIAADPAPLAAGGPAPVRHPRWALAAACRSAGADDQAGGARPAAG